MGNERERRGKVIVEKEQVVMNFLPYYHSLNIS